MKFPLCVSQTVFMCWAATTTTGHGKLCWCSFGKYAGSTSQHAEMTCLDAVFFAHFGCTCFFCMIMKLHCKSDRNRTFEHVSNNHTSYSVQSYRQMSDDYLSKNNNIKSSCISVSILLTCLSSAWLRAARPARLLADGWEERAGLWACGCGGSVEGDESWQDAASPQRASSLHPPGDAPCVMTRGRLTSALRGAGRAARQPGSSLCNASDAAARLRVAGGENDGRLV